MQRLRGSDAYAIYSETSTSPFVTLKVGIYRPTQQNDVPDSKDLRRFIKRSISLVGATSAALRILRVPFDLHHPVWLQVPGFSPDDHIHEVSLPQPGSKTQLCDFLSDLMGKPLDYDRPPWEVWLVNGLEEGRVAIACKVHHALADGKTVARLIAEGHTSAPAVEKQQEQPTVEEPVPGKSRLIGDALVDLARSYTVELPQFYSHLKQARRKGATVKEAVEQIVAPFSAPFTIFNAQGVSRERLYRYQTFSLPDFKALSKAFDCSINTLVLGVCSEALKRYLEEIDALPAEPLITVMPIGDQSGSSLKRMLNSDIQNNNLAVAILPLFHNIADIVQRLKAINKAAQAAIDHVQHDDGRRFDNYLDFMPGTAIRLINAAMIRRQKKNQSPYANLVISNVAGPRETLYALDGRLEMEELLSAGNLMDGGHLNITVWSYVDKLAFSFFIRKDVLPQPDRMIDHLQDVVAELRATYLATGQGPGQ